MKAMLKITRARDGLALFVLVAQLMLSACGSGGSTATPIVPGPESDIGSTTDSEIAITTDGASDANPDATLDIQRAPLVTMSDFRFIGGFTLPATEYGDSSMNYAKGVIEQSGDSLFIVGHTHHDMIAEFSMPELVNSENIGDLNSAGDPVQLPTSVLGRATAGNSQGINEISGLEVIDSQLVINGYEYYDAPADNSHTTLIASNAFNLMSADIHGYYEMQGSARAGGWISAVPPEWTSLVGGDYLTGFSSGEPIISRLSVGPSAFITDRTALFDANTGDPDIATTKLLEFDLENPLHVDLFNASGENKIWTHTTAAVYGFIIPGTRTYATFGHTSGFESGIGYKITQDDGTLCGGYCSYSATDTSNYYWFWDMTDLLAVKNGELAAHEVRPYAHGPFDVPFQTSDTLNPIGGGTYDAATGTLYVSVLRADNTQGTYSNPPVIAAFSVNPFR